MLGEQVSHGHHGGPARLGVVADVDHPTDFELAADEVDDHSAVLVRDPAPDAMQADVVELGQIRAGAKSVKAFVKQLST